MWDLRVCRGCLVTDTEGKLEPLNKMLKMGYQALTGLEMKDGDGYPTYFCLECCVHIKKAWAFRRKSRRAFFVMREIMIIRNEVTIKDIQTINRDKTHLNSTSSYWNLKNNTIFNIDKTEDEECSMVEYKPVINNLVCHSIEVIPEITQNIEEEEPEPAVEDTIDNVDDANDNDHDNIPAEIDLEDVFKDLKEESSSESEMEELEEVKVEKTVVKKVEKKKIQDTSKVFNLNAFDIRVTKLSKALCNTNIVVLSDVDQKSMQVIRSKMHPFVTAKFKCALCLIVFVNINELMKHVNDHKAWQGNHMCHVCKNRFSTEEQLHIHKVENHLYEYTCKTCSQISYTLIDVIKHNEDQHPEVLKSTSFKMISLRSHFKFIRLKQKRMYAHSTRILSCKKCNKHFRNRHDFADHVSNHKGKTYYYCDICLRCNRSKNSLQDHIIKFHFYNYRCKQCSQVFFNRYKAKNHVRSGFCKQESQDVIKCDICHAKTTSKLNLMAHQMYMHYSQVYLHECNLCGHSYTTLNSLYKHQISIHKYISPMDPKLGDPEHTCTICNYQFYSRRAYQKHAVRANHPEVAEFANACRPCRRLFDSEEQRKNHSCNRSTRVHYPRACDFCDQILIDANEREAHYTNFHPHHDYGKKRTLCQICGALVSRFRYSKHMKNHTGDLLHKYECNRCHPSTSWPNVYGYVEHVITSHTHKPYHCTICYAAFRYKSVCRDHILKEHEPAKQYVCRYCEQHFAHRDYLIQHSKDVHNVIIQKKKQDRIRKNIYVYPHMKIDVSLVESEILQIIKVDLYDYIHKKYEELDDPSNYLITDTFFQRTQPSAMKRKAPYTGAKKMKKPKLSVDKIKSEECVVTTRTVIFDKRAKFKPEENENKDVFKDGTQVVDFKETVAASEFLVNDIKVFEKNDEKIEASDIKEDVIKYGREYDETKVFKSEVKNIVPKNEMVDSNSQVTSDGVIEETIEQELEIFDIDGQNYVMLDGILYKVETE